MGNMYDGLEEAPTAAPLAPTSPKAPPGMYDGLEAAPAPTDGTQPAPRPAEGVAESFQAGLQASSMGLAYRRKLPDLMGKEHETFWEGLAKGVGGLAGDILPMTVGAMAGGAAGGAAGTAVAGPVGTLAGGMVGAGAGMGAVPAIMRESLTDFYRSGEGTTKAEWWNMLRASAAQVLKETGVSAATFGALGVAGRVTGRAIAPLIGDVLSVPTQVAGKAAAEVGGATTALAAANTAAMIVAFPTIPALLDARLPDMAELGHSAIIIGGLTLGHAAAGRIESIYRRTGKTPAEIVADAQSDPALANEIAKPPEAEVPPLRGQLSKQEELWTIQDQVKNGASPADVSVALSKYADDLQLRGNSKEWATKLPGLPRGVYEALSELKPADRGAEEEGQLQELRRRVLEAREDPETAMRAVWGPELANAPPELRGAIERGMALPETPSGVPRDVVAPAGPRFDPEEMAKAQEQAKTRLEALTAKAGTEALSDTESAERVLLTNAMGNPEALAKRFGIQPVSRGPTAAEHEASAQRVYDDVLAQIRASNAAKQAAGQADTGDKHAQDVAALTRDLVKSRAGRLGVLPEDLYNERRLQIRDETQAEIAAEQAAVPPDATRFTPPEVDLFGEPIPTATPRHAIEGVEPQMVPVPGLTLSKDVPQFKGAANEKGIVEPLTGEWDPTGVGPIQIWERLNGDMEVISGRHRLDMVQRKGVPEIWAQIHKEADGFTRDQASTLDAILNIRDGQGSIADYAQYFKTARITQAAADAAGLLGRVKGRTGFAIARDASPDVLAAHRAGLLSDDAALSISSTAPGSERLQALGIAMVNDGKSILYAANMMRSIDLMASERMAAGAQGDIFGFDDSAMREAAAMAKKASSKQRAISEQISAVSGASRRPELARKMGVDVQDPEGIQKKIAELKQEQYQWDNWPLYPELVAKLRAPERTGEVTRARPEPSIEPPVAGFFDSHPPPGEAGLNAQIRDYFSNNKAVEKYDVLSDGEYAFFKQPDGSYATVPDITKATPGDYLAVGSIFEVQKIVKAAGAQMSEVLLPGNQIAELRKISPTETLPGSDPNILHQDATPFELKAETPAELKARDEEAAAAAKRKLAQERAGVKGPVPTVDQADLFSTQRTLFQQADNGIPVNADKLTREVLSKIDRALKAMGYDSRGADDVRNMLKTKIAPEGVLSHPDWLKAYEQATGSAEKRKATKAAADLEKAQATHVDFDRIRALGTTTDIREAGYITPTGSFIDLSGKREGGQAGTRAYDHREAGGTDGMQEFMAIGNIRMDHNAGTMNLAKEPTPEQYRKIAQFAQAKNGEVVIDLERGLGEYRDGYYGRSDGAFSREYPKGTKPTRILADIQRYYADEEPLPLRDVFQTPGQERDGQHLGSYSIAENLIVTFQNANKSTIVHELGHHWLEQTKGDAARPEAPAQLKADWDTIRREFAIGENGEISTASHEQFARTWERYLGEGVAPSVALRGVFERFKAWMLEIYANLQNLGAEISPEVRGVFDRMLASDQEIADAKELNVPRVYVPEARRVEAEKIVPPPEARKIDPGFEAEQASMQPYADELPKGPGEAPDSSHINYGYINSPMDVKLTMQRMAEIDQANIQKQRGGTAGVKSWAEANAEQAKYVNDILGGSPDTLKVLSGRDPDAPGPDVKLGVLKKMAVGAAKDSARLRDVVLEHGADATVREQLEYMGSIERARMIQAEFLGERAGVARALNALKDTNEGSGEIGRMLDAIGYGEAAARELYQTAKTQAEENAILKAKLDEILQNYRGKTVLDIAKLHKEIGTLKGSYIFAKKTGEATTWEMVVEGWKSSILSGPVTHTTNFVGTEAFHQIRPAIDALAAMIGMARGASPGMGESDRASMSEAVARITGMLGGVMDGLKVAKATFNMEEVTGKTESYRTAIPGKAGDIIRIPLRMMAAEDAMVTTMYSRGEIATLAIRTAFDENLNPSTREFSERVSYLKDNPTPEMVATAEAAATRMTFNMPLGEKGIALQSFVNKWNLQWMIPFIRTPINIAKELLRMSPFAPAVGEWRAAIAKGGVERDRALAEITLGTGITAATMAYAFSGSISGAGSPDPGKNRGKAGVWQPYSILIGDTWYEYSRIQPTGTLMGMAADIANIWDHMTPEEMDKTPKLLAAAFANAITNQTFLQGITNFVNAMSDPTRFGPRFLQQFAGSMVPNVIGQPTAMADPAVREVNSMIEAIQARIPGLRQDLLPKRDWLGEPVPSKERLGVVLPVREQQVSEDKVRLEADRLDLSMAGAPKKTHIGKGTGKLGDVDLTPEERNKFAEISGKFAHGILTNIVNAPGYDQIPDPVKRKIFTEILTASHKLAAVEALPMDKRLAYITQITEKVATELAPSTE